MTWFALLLTYPVWVLIHEGTHALAAVHLGGVGIRYFRPWPHRSDKGFRWGAVGYTAPVEPPRVAGWVSFAPRLPAACAVLALPILAHAGAPPWALVLLAGGAVDQLVNSLGISEHSDLRRWCASWGHEPWIWRILGAGSALLSGGFTLVT